MRGCARKKTNHQGTTLPLGQGILKIEEEGMMVYHFKAEKAPRLRELIKVVIFTSLQRDEREHEFVTCYRQDPCSTRPTP